MPFYDLEVIKFCSLMLYVKKYIILVCSILSVIVLLITSIDYLPITTFDIDWESSRFSTQKNKLIY